MGLEHSMDGHSEHWMVLEHSMGWALRTLDGAGTFHGMGIQTLDGAGTFHRMGIIGAAIPGTKQRKPYAEKSLQH